MNPVEWLQTHRSEIVEHWKHRVRPLAAEHADLRWEKRIDDSFEQICVLAGGDGLEITVEDVEGHLSRCVAIREDNGRWFSARILVCGREALHDVAGPVGDDDAKRCAGEGEKVIDYLQHMLRANVCRDCKEINCCMRVEMLGPMPGGVNE